MGKTKIYKFNQNQLKLIVESQKSSPQLQTEILDRTADNFGKILTWGFKQSINAFKYLSGIGVNVFYGNRYTPTGKFPLKKRNPLAPLSLYKPQLAGLPQNYQNIFKTFYNEIGTNKNQNNTTTNNQQTTDQSNPGETSIDAVINELKFDNVNGVTYQIKFQFQNLKKEAKENAELMMTTWGLIFNVKCEGNATENNTMTWELVGFSSQGPSVSRFLSMASGKQGDKEGNVLVKALSQYAGASSNQLSLIFTNKNEASRFAKGMKKQIDDHMKVMIGQVNSDMGVKNTIKVPMVSVIVSPLLIGDSNLQPENQKAKPINEIENDINEIMRQIELYKDQDQYKKYVEQLNYILKRLVLQRKQVQNK